jgi:hypothetical protein
MGAFASPRLSSVVGAPLTGSDREDNFVGPFAFDELVLDEVRLAMQSCLLE